MLHTFFVYNVYFFDSNSSDFIDLFLTCLLLSISTLKLNLDNRGFHVRRKCYCQSERL